VFPDCSSKKLSLSWIQYSQQQSVLLRGIVDRIRNSLEVKVVLQSAVDEVAALLKLDCCCFFWYFRDTERVQVVCECFSKRDRVSQLGYHPLEAFGGAAGAIANGQLLIRNGTAANSPGLPPLIARLASRLQRESRQSGRGILGACASLLIPVRKQDGEFGFLACLADKPRFWSAMEVEFIQSLAQQLEIALCQAQLYEQTQKQAQREKLVNHITTQTRQSFDLEKILTEAIAQLLEALDADRCLVHLVEGWGDGPTKDLKEKQEVESFRRKHLYEVCREPFPASAEDFDPHGPITQWVIQHGKPAIISDVAEDERIDPSNEEYQKAQIKSSLVVPVQANETLYAILYLNQCSYPRYWSDNDQRLAHAVADQLAISLQQARLYAKTQRQAAENATRARELAETLQELRQTQSQLIQSEKMSSLGQLVAGLAHEINNPISFIYGNIPYIETYVCDLIRLLFAYQGCCADPPVELQDLAKEVELDFLLRDLPHLLRSMKAGTERIRELIVSLQNFSRLDQAARKEVDIHQGLESSLTLLSKHLQGEIQVVRHYGDLPLVECYARQINQVFMNLLINAVEALNRSEVVPKKIVLHTELILMEDANVPWIRVAIADNGPGIAAEIQSKIFDPFFTTKEIGQGMGLGLAASYQTIVNQHQGNLKFSSKPNTGSEFMLEIPIKLLNPLSANCEQAIDNPFESKAAIATGE